MKFIFYTMFLTVSIFSSDFSNPHKYKINDDVNDNVCINCHMPADINKSYETTDYYVFDSSKLCLGCHDGTIATNMEMNFPESPGHNATATLSIHGHPVSVMYDDFKNNLKSKETQLSGWGNALTLNDLLRDSKIECISCHNPHNPTFGKYLRHSNKNSEFCLTCHIK